MARNNDKLATKYDNKKVMVVRGREMFTEGKVVAKSAFTKGPSTWLMIRIPSGGYVWATTKQVEVL